MHRVRLRVDLGNGIGQRSDCGADQPSAGFQAQGWQHVPGERAGISIRLAGPLPRGGEGSQTSCGTVSGCACGLESHQRPGPTGGWNEDGGGVGALFFLGLLQALLFELSQ